MLEIVLTVVGLSMTDFFSKNYCTVFGDSVIHLEMHILRLFIREKQYLRFKFTTIAKMPKKDSSETKIKGGTVYAPRKNSSALLARRGKTYWRLNFD